MIKIVEGNILDATEDIIAHSCNAQGKMGSGVAKAVRGKYPFAFEAYTDLVDAVRPHQKYLLGTCQIVFTDKVIANLIAQEFYGYDGGRYTDVNALLVAMKQLELRVRETHESIAMPYMIGCARGGASWGNEVFPMIQDVFKLHKVTLYKYEG